ncbi:MAG: L,D-transpeptidase [Anaerolineae bacterium]
MSRRAVLKAAAGAAALGFIPPLQTDFEGCDDGSDYDSGGRVDIDDDETISYNALYNNPPLLGRVEYVQAVLEEPAAWDRVVRRIFYGDVVPIYGTLRAEPPSALPHNDVWFELDDGFVHSSFVVPVTEHFHRPEPVIGNGFWGEITVTTSWQHRKPTLSSKRYYDLAWGAVYQVIDRVDEACGRSWYRIVDDANPHHPWWVQAHHVRRMRSPEFAPISPAVPPEHKRIEVIIDEQLLTCYEYGQPVFSTRIASGATFWDSEGNPLSFHTPYGEHYVQRKTPSRHMSGGEDINDFFDLPGVPWCTFLSFKGAAIHGTYWHNDYGRPRSHGCVNVTPDAAKWIYRWVYPVVGYEDIYYWTGAEERETATIIDIKRTRA